jgi:hypothetical protein
VTETANPPKHAEFLSLVPGVEAHARIRFRHLNPSDREEAVADAVAYGFASFLRLTRRGKEPTAFPVAFSRFTAQAVSNGRAVGRRFTSRDVMAWPAQRRRGVTVHRFDDPTPDGGGWWRDVAAGSRAGVADQAAFNIDFPKWLSALTAVKRRVAKLLAQGHPTGATAGLVGVSPARVSQIRQELAASWSAFHAGT